jgi:hydroxypyruvate isomerase
MQGDIIMPNSTSRIGSLSRRGFFAGTAAAWASVYATGRGRTLAAAEPEREAPPEDYRIENGRIRQSVYGWCFRPLKPEVLIDACHRMGVPAMDTGAGSYPLLRERGMKLTMVGAHGFAKGPFSPANREFCVTKLREAIDTAVKCECDNVITFTGMREEGISDAEGARNCVACWKEVIEHAESQGVNLCLEILNTRDDSHPMKGHPGYFGDDVERCVDLIRQVDSPRMKLLFDVYHVQVMNGDVIRRIRQYQDLIGHYHVAGNPGRGEPDDTQEINYPAVLRAILDTGYTGFVSQEFIPTWPDKLAALRHSVRLCDI